MEVLSQFGYKLLFSEKHGYKTLFQDENLAQNNPILHHTFMKIGVEQGGEGLKGGEGKFFAWRRKDSQ